MNIHRNVSEDSNRQLITTSPARTTPARHTEIAEVGWAMPIITLIGTAFAIFTAFLGSGAIRGTPIAEAAGGALSADATPLAPAGAAFGIWSVIYAGLAGYAIWQLFPAARRSPRQKHLRPWALLSVILNAVWIWTVQFDQLWASVLVITVLLAVLIRIMYILGEPRTGGWPDLILTEATFGLYFGWVLVATFANIFAFLADSGLDMFTDIAVGVGGIVLAGLIGVVTAIVDGGRIAPALATSWGLAWIAVGRTTGSYESQLLVVTAAAASAIVLLSALIAWALRRKANPHTRP
ncbi:TspO/MBR family protein [uncultured Corynebacterium sp.]|uniref:TspO/MBR family protein n=1 Tax=uncultured Corynebacterium sp. TaxID=159447 RepID=UPI0025F29B77|nr:TspO/MBR family protein [uncultured Corynebacterium sp.]